MTLFVPGDNLQSRAYRKTKHLKKRILKPDAVHIVITGLADEFPGRVVTS